MYENLISIGDKIELKQIADRSVYRNDDDDELRIYVSQVLDIKDDIIYAAMPIFEGHLIPLQVGTLFESYYYGQKTLYKCSCKIVGRTKEENVYFVLLQPITKLEKYQRREYFRFDCNIDVAIFEIEDKSVQHDNKEQDRKAKDDNIKDTNNEDGKIEDGKIEDGVIRDLSGGGLRIFSHTHYEKNTRVRLQFCLQMNDMVHKIKVNAKILSSTRDKTRLNIYEQRIQFKNMDYATRELIVKYIFEEQRRIRQKERE